MYGAPAEHFSLFFSSFQMMCTQSRTQMTNCKDARQKLTYVELI